LERDAAGVARGGGELAHVASRRGHIAYDLYMDGRYASAAGRSLDGLPAAEETWRRWGQRTGRQASDRRYWEIYAATFIAIIATRAMHLAYGFDTSDIERANPIIPDIETFLEEAEQ